MAVRLMFVNFILAVVLTTSSIVARPAQTVQQQHVDVNNAIQDQRLSVLERQEASTSNRVDLLAASVDSLAGAINKFTGIGIGIGGTIMVLQALQLIVQVKRKIGEKSDG